MAGRTRSCEVCGVPIGAERAEALLETRLCREHARQVEKYGGEFVLTATQERTSKPGSLKRGYGSVLTSRRRNHEAVARLREEYLRGRG
jgi:hypothetical protein